MSDSVAKRIDKLREAIRRHDRLYYVEAKPVIPDREYDALMDELRRLEEEHPELRTPDSPSQRVGGEPIEGFVHVRHAVPMRSVDNTYNEQELREFDGRVAKGLGGDSYKYVVDPKIDGVAVSIRYEGGLLSAAVTRGDGQVGDDITHNIRTIPAVPLRLEGKDVPDVLEVRGEVVWPTKAFLKFNKEREARGEQTFANPRNATAGSLKQLDPKNIAGRGLIFVAHGFGVIEPLPTTSHWELFKTFKRFGIPVSPYADLKDSVEGIIKNLSRWDERRHQLPYETDGLVVKIDSLDQRDALGETSKYPRWCIAYKFAAEQAESVLLSVDYQVGKLGTITPRAVMEPMQLSGTTVRHATLHNFDQVKRLDVRVGDTVVVEKAGEIIPQVVRVLKEKRPEDATKIKRPAKCPVCKGDVERDEGGVYIRCINPSCPAQLKERLIFFAGRNQMDIEGAGQVVIEALVDAGKLTDASSFYELQESELAELELPPRQLSEKEVDALLAPIERSKKKPLSDLLPAFKISGVSNTAARRIANHFRSIDELARATAKEIANSAGVHPEIAASMVAFFNPPSADVLKKHLLRASSRGALDLKGMGPVRIDKLVDGGLVRTMCDLYDLGQKRAKLATLEFKSTFGRRNAAKLMHGIRQSKQQPFARLLAALNIRHVGGSTAELLANHFRTIDGLMNASIQKLVAVDGVGPEVASSVHRFFESTAAKDVISRLKKAGVTMQQEEPAVQGGAPLKGMTIVFTGTLSRLKRNEAEARVKSLGGKTSSSVSSETDWVVYGENAGSKLAKAQSLGVETIDEEEFLHRIGN